MKKSILFWVGVFFKWILVTVNIAVLVVGVPFMLYTFTHGVKIFYLGYIGWFLIFIVAGCSVAAIKKLRNKQYLFDSIDKEFKETLNK